MRSSHVKELFSKEALGEGGDEANLDEEAHNSFYSSKSSIGIAQCHTLRKEAAPMKTTHTEDKSFIPC